MDGATAAGPGLEEALRASREALVDVQNQLDALLRAVRAAGGADPIHPPGGSRAQPDCLELLVRSTSRADAAIRSLRRA